MNEDIPVELITPSDPPPVPPPLRPACDEPGETSQQSFFHKVRWSHLHLVFGILLLAGFWSLNLVPREAMKMIPPWVLLLTGVVIFQGFQIFYPFLGARRRSGRPKIGVRKFFIEAALAIPLTIGVIIVLNVALHILSRLAPDLSFTPEVWQNISRSNNYTLLIVLTIVTTILAPLSEEIFFRGYLYNAFRTRLGVTLAILVSSVIFAVVHSYEPAPTVVIFVLGVCLAVIYQWRKTLLAPIFVHSGFNLMSMIGLLMMMMAHANTPMIGVSSEEHPDGLRVTMVSEDSGAEKAGIQVGDIITKIDGQAVKSRKDLFTITRTCKVGDMVKLKLIRDKTPMNKSVVLGSRPEPNKPPEKP